MGSNIDKPGAWITSHEIGISRFRRHQVLAVQIRIMQESKSDNLSIPASDVFIIKTMDKHNTNDSGTG